MSTHFKTLMQYLVESRRAQPQSTSGDLNSLIIAIATACKVTSKLVAQGRLRPEPEGSLEDQALEVFTCGIERTGLICGILSDREELVATPPRFVPRGHYSLVLDPLDGVSNVEFNTTAGSIFSVLRTPGSGTATEADFLQPGSQQVVSGYAVYGPMTMLVLTLGHGTQGFTLDPLTGEWLLTHPFIKVPQATTEFHINSSNARFWEAPVKRYVDECLAGSQGERGKDFNMRWVASLVGDAHRILLKGGVFLYPRLTKPNLRLGRLLLLQEVNPVAWLIEQAGGGITTGSGSPLEVTPTKLLQHSPLIFGSLKEVQRIARYHSSMADQTYSSPLFGERGLFADRD